MFDIGVNLTNSQLVEDVSGVLDRAGAAGVIGIAVTGTSVSDSRLAVELCNRYQPVFPGVLCATAGVHPHHASEWNEDARQQLLALAQEPAVRAIGETGLDFNRNFSTPAEQIEAFKAQLEIAAATGLPLFLHEREAFATQIGLLHDYRDHISGAVAHCFTGNREQLQAYLELDFYIGITGWVCDERRGQELASLVPQIPLERLLIETDAPWLLPRNIHPRPGKRINEPAFLGWISREVARLCNRNELEIRERTLQNALNFFQIS